MTNSEIIKIVMDIETSHCEVEYEDWQQICELLSKRSGSPAA